MSLGQGPDQLPLTPSPCSPPHLLYSPWFLAEPPEAILPLFLIRPFWSEHPSRLSASSATLFRTFSSSSSLLPLMRWRDHEGTGFIVESRSYRAIQTHNRIKKGLTLDPRYLRDRTDEWRLKGEQEFPLSLWPHFLTVVLPSRPPPFFIFNFCWRCSRGDRWHRLCASVKHSGQKSSYFPGSEFLSQHRFSFCNLCFSFLIFFFI